MVQRTLIRPPSSRMGPITPQERAGLMAQSPVAGQYDKTIDRESAFEILQKRAQAQVPEQPQSPQRGNGDPGNGGQGGRWTLPDFDGDGGAQRPAPAPRAPAPRAPRTSNRQTVAEAAVKSVVRSVGSSLGRAIVRGILGSMTKR
jgi:hypothetical protein